MALRTRFAPGPATAIVGPAIALLVDGPIDHPLVARLGEAVVDGAGIDVVGDILAEFESLPQLAFAVPSPGRLRVVARGVGAIADRGPRAAAEVLAGSGSADSTHHDLGPDQVIRFFCGTGDDPAGYALLAGVVPASVLEITMGAAEPADGYLDDEQTVRADPDDLVAVLRAARTGSTTIDQPGPPPAPGTGAPVGPAAQGVGIEPPVEAGTSAERDAPQASVQSPIREPGLITSVPKQLHSPPGRATSAPGVPSSGSPPVDDLTEAVTPAPRAAAGRSGRSVRVQAVFCPAGHPNAPHASDCRSCGRPITDPSITVTERPALGVLRVPDGRRVPVERSMLIGRRPERGEWDLDDEPHLVTIDDGALSRVHLELRVSDWAVQAIDLGSTNGTVVEPPNRPPRVLRAREAVPLVVGSRLVLGETVELLFEVSE